MFKNNTEITSFDELHLFSGINFTSGAFAGCTSLSKITIGWKTLTETFIGCTNLVDVRLLEGVESIYSNVFRNTSLEYIELPKTIKYVGNIAEGNYIHSILIPRDCETVGPVAKGSKYKGDKLVVCNKKAVSISGEMFRDCSNAYKRELYVPAEYPPSMPVQPATYYLNASAIYVPKGCLSVYQNADYWNNFSSIMQEYDFNVNPNGIRKYYEE